MKKNLLSLAAVFAAGITQAASLNWTLMSVPASSGSGTGAAYTVMLFMTAQSKDPNFGKPNTTIAAVTELADAGDYAALAALAAAEDATNSSGGIIAKATGYNGNNFAAGDSLSAFALILDTEKKNYFLTDIKNASWTSGTGSKTLGFGSQSGATYKSFGDVPEPATGALALAGVALLFRRRRA